LNQAITDTEPLTPNKVEYAAASQWRLMWWQFTRHRVAMAGAIVVLIVLLTAVFAEFIAPTNPLKFNPRFTYAPPQRVHFFRHQDGQTTFSPHVLSYSVRIDSVALTRIFVADPEKPIRIGLFVDSDPYALWGIVPLRTKLIGPINASDSVFFFGADSLGRDVLSRIVYGGQISISIGLVGVFLSLVLGIVLGGISGYYGGGIDHAIQRCIEFILSLPTIPLWLGLAAAMPRDWSPLLVYFCITVILSLVGWTSLARVIRSRFLSLRTEDFVAAARLDGSSEMRIILRHMMPSVASHIIAAVSLAIPAMILAETSLSFLGLGLQPPIISWGVLLQDAQSIRVLATAPWLFAPGAAVVITVLALNFLGDGLRDAADPYGNR
jgi:peptide/nickel transport system permease protein